MAKVAKEQKTTEEAKTPKAAKKPRTTAAKKEAKATQAEAAPKAAKVAPVLDASVTRVRDYSVLVRPLITEKSSIIGSTSNSVVFVVDRRATKTDIREAVERIFSVKVDSVRTVNVLGKVKRTAKSVGRRAHAKKAYVTLKEGHSINVVEGL